MRRNHCQRGFTLIEALVSLLVLAFGLLAIASFQITLSRNSDVAKQRTEATRLAQEKLEQLRTYPTLTVYGNQMVSSTNLTQETITTNTDFTRSWAVTTAGSVDTGRTLTVTVAWADRTGATQQVQLFSNISSSDPSEVGGLWFPLPDGTILRRPKDRNIDIPIPATTITGTDKSYVPWAGGSAGFLVFSNVSGDIVQKCTGTTAPDAALLANSGVCTTFNGYVLTGYISGSLVASVTGITFSGFAGKPSTTPECTVGNATDQNNGTTALTGFKYYACLIQPTETTPRIWTGRTDLTGTGLTSGKKSCRYTTDTATTVNNNHPATYTSVDRSLDNQNFNVISSGNCPTGSVLHKTY